MITDFKLAEVIDTEKSYELNSTLFSITVRTISDTNIKIYTDVRPANLHNCSIPIPGEHVLIFQGLLENSNTTKRRYVWYYLTTYSLQSSINNNLLPGVTYETNGGDGAEFKTAYKKQISEKFVLPLQQFPGDHVYQGRWGNTIRLGSTIKSENVKFSKNPSWSKGEGTDGDPIIILSNTKLTNDNTINVNGATVPTSYQVENLNSDYSSLYLTSTQQISGYTVKKSLKQENVYKSQFIGVADRINLNAKTDSVTINAPNNIELNTDKVVFGTSSNKEPGIYSTDLWNVLNNIINVLSLGVLAADKTTILSVVAQDSLNEACAQLNDIFNHKIQQDKRTE